MANLFTRTAAGVALLAASASAAVSAEREAFTIVYDTIGNGRWYFDADDTRTGPAVDLLNATADPVDLPITFIRAPWARALKLLELGQVDALFDAAYRESRTAFAVYPTRPGGRPDPARRLYTRSYVFLTAADRIVTWDGARLAPADTSIGYLQDTAISDRVARMARRSETATKPESLIRMVLTGRVDALAGLPEGLLTAARGMGVADQLVELQPPLDSFEVYLIFNKQIYADRRLDIEDFWDGLREARETGRWTEILETYQNQAQDR